VYLKTGDVVELAISRLGKQRQKVMPYLSFK
jgi:2-keto-4-pentenoate hydratase/2-oxohepta-3-ene-1,7-dioic acid hydratase in catechol pathway